MAECGCTLTRILEYLVERKYDKYGTLACERAASYAPHLDCLKYLHETAKAPWDEDAVWEAHHYNQTECLQYLLDNNCPLPEGWSYEGGVLHAPKPDEYVFDDDDDFSDSSSLSSSSS